MRPKLFVLACGITRATHDTIDTIDARDARRARDAIEAVFSDLALHFIFFA